MIAHESTRLAGVTFPLRHSSQLDLICAEILERLTANGLAETLLADFKDFEHRGQAHFWDLFLGLEEMQLFLPDTRPEEYASICDVATKGIRAGVEEFLLTQSTKSLYLARLNDFFYDYTTARHIQSFLDEFKPNPANTDFSREVCRAYKMYTINEGLDRFHLMLLDRYFFDSSTGLMVYLSDNCDDCPNGWVLAESPSDTIFLLRTGRVTHLSLPHDFQDNHRGDGPYVLNRLLSDVVSREYAPPMRIAIRTKLRRHRRKMLRMIRKIRKAASQSH